MFWVRQTLILRTHSGSRAHSGFRQTQTLGTHHANHVCPGDVPVVIPVRPASGNSFVLVAKPAKMDNGQRRSKD